MKVLFSNLTILTIALLVGSFSAELYLRFDGRYADLVDDNLVHSRAIWDRPASDIQHRRHPDLDYDVEIIFNDFRIRNHDGVELHHIKEYDGKIVGIFGDSMTENRRVDDQFSFSSILQQALKPDFLVLNFGVDGYGTDQSYLKYLDFEERSRLNHVFYIFFRNDLRNIYENQLFQYSNDQLGEPIPPAIDPVIDFVRRFHVCYLLLDSYARLKAMGSTQGYSPEDLNEKIAARFVSDKKAEEQKARFHDEYADSLARDFLSDSPSSQTIEWGNRFRDILKAWDADVRSHGGEFAIFVPPYEKNTTLAKKLFGDEFSEQTVYMSDYFSIDSGSFKFENDGHWNEKGNLRAAQAIMSWGSVSAWPNKAKSLERISTEIEAEIEELYQEYR